MQDIKASQFPARETILKYCPGQTFLLNHGRRNFLPTMPSTFNNLPGFDLDLWTRLNFLGLFGSRVRILALTARGVWRGVRIRKCALVQCEVFLHSNFV